MRKKHNRRSRGPKRRRSLKASNAGPILALTGTVVGILGALALIVFVGVPWLLPKIGFDGPLPWQPTPTPAPTPKPTPTPHPVAQVDVSELQREVVLEDYRDYVWFAEPSAWGDTLVFAAGRTIDGDALMDAIFTLDMDTGEAVRLSLPLKNHHYVYPTVNERWLAYLDAKEGNGATLSVMERATGEIREIKDIYVGQPMLRLSGDLLVWTERTGSTMDKLFACDLNTLESVTVQMFSNSEYGLSAPGVAENEILYADDDPNSTAEGQANTSAIYSVDIAAGTAAAYTPGTYVHDPLTNGKQWVWRDGLHGTEDNLYLAVNGGKAQLIAEGIMDYGLSDTFLAYSKDRSIYVYFFDDKSTHRITPDPDSEHTNLLCVSDGTVVWMDVTSRDRDIMKYARVS